MRIDELQEHLEALLQIRPAVPEEHDAVMRRANQYRRRRIARRSLGGAFGVVLLTLATVATFSQRHDDTVVIRVHGQTQSTPQTSPPPLPSGLPSTAYVSDGSRLFAIDVASRNVRATLAHFSADAPIEWVTLDGPRHRVFFGVTSGCDPGVNGIWVVDTSGGGLRKVAAVGYRAAVSPDGTKLAFPIGIDGCGVQAIVIHDLRTGKEQRIDRPSRARFITGVGWVTDRYLVFSDLELLGVHTIDTDATGGPRVIDDGAVTPGKVVDSVIGGYALQNGCTQNVPVGCKSRLSILFAPGRRSFELAAVPDVQSWSVDATGKSALAIVDTGAGSGHITTMVRVVTADGSWDLIPGHAADW